MAYAPPTVGLVPPEAKYGIAGVAVGLTLNEFFAEWAARVSGQTDWGLVGVKAVVKIIIAALFWWIGRAVVAPMTKLFLNIVGFTTTGSIVWDIFRQLYPGGIWGAAQAAAIAARTAATPAAALAQKYRITVPTTAAPGTIRLPVRVPIPLAPAAPAAPTQAPTQPKGI